MCFYACFLQRKFMPQTSSLQALKILALRRDSNMFYFKNPAELAAAQWHGSEHGFFCPEGRSRVVRSPVHARWQQFLWALKSRGSSASRTCCFTPAWREARHLRIGWISPAGVVFSIYSPLSKSKVLYGPSSLKHASGGAPTKTHLGATKDHPLWIHMEPGL